MLIVGLTGLSSLIGRQSSLVKEKLWIKKKENENRGLLPLIQSDIIFNDFLETAAEELVENGRSHPSKNPGWGCLYFTYRLYPGLRYGFNYSPLSYG